MAVEPENGSLVLHRRLLAAEVDATGLQDAATAILRAAQFRVSAIDRTELGGKVAEDAETEPVVDLARAIRV